MKNAKLLKFDEIALSITERVDDPASAGVTRYVGLEHLDPESIEITRWGTPEDVSATKLRFYPKDVIYGRRRAYQKKLGVARFEGICSAHALVLRARQDFCLAEFLPYFLHSDQFHNRALEISVGSLSPTINWSTLKLQKFELPSIEEQQRIVELLSGVDAHAEALRNQLHVANETRKSVLHHLLTAGGDDWTETTLGNVIQLSYGKALKAEDRDGDGFPVFGSAGEVGQHSEPNVPFVPVVIVGRKGTAGAVWWSDIPCSVIDTAYFLVLKAEGNPKYFYHLLESLDLPTLTAQTGVPGLNRDRVHSCEFLCPPLIEQQRIVDEISKIDAVIQETTSALAATRQLRSALLNKEIS
jgi:restriction endonuclease S subunit